MSKKKSMVKPVIFMIILSVILTFILAFVNEITSPKISENTELALMEKILYVFDIDYEANDPESIKATFNENVEEDEYDGKPLFVYKPSGDVEGYAVQVNGPGLWGSISGYVGVSADFNSLLGISFTEQDETPGLGGRIEEEEYKSQYRGLDIEGKDSDFVINKPAPGGNIDAISGATQTSTFVVDLVNKDLQSFIEDMGGNK